jgi:hypothetical protein
VCGFRGMIGQRAAPVGPGAGSSVDPVTAQVGGGQRIESYDAARAVRSTKATRSAKLRCAVSCLLPSTLVIAAEPPSGESSTQDGTVASTVLLRSLQMATFGW